MFVCRTYSHQEDVPAELDTRGLSIGSGVLYMGHKGTVAAFREPDSFISYTALVEVNWGGLRSEWFPAGELRKAV